MSHKQSINIPTDLYGWIKRKADRHHITVSAEINVILSELMDEEMEPEDRATGTDGEQSKDENHASSA